MQSTRVTPSPEARRLYGRMVARADSRLLLSLDQTLALAIEVNRPGEAVCDGTSHVEELQTQGWIAPDKHSGGWKLADVSWREDFGLLHPSSD